MNTTHLIALMAVGVLAMQASAAAEAFVLRKNLNERPDAANLEAEASVEMVDGRFDEQSALRIDAGAAAWDIADAPEDVFVEFWMKPAAWDGFAEEAVTVAELGVGGETYRLEKPAEAHELRLMRDDEALQSYPLYNWQDQSWMDRLEESVRWHYVNIFLASDGVELTIDGFPARDLTDDDVVPSGRLERVALHGAPGTVFSWLHVVDSPRKSFDELRARYRALYLGEPLLHTNTVTVPRLERDPNVDGPLTDDERARAARIVGFTGRDGAPYFTHEPITGHLAWDERALYLALDTPYEGELRTRAYGERGQPIWRDESYEIFICPAWTGTPEYVQLVGNPHGDRTDLRGMDRSWRGRWAWHADLADDHWTGELHAEFAGLDFAAPEAGEVWTMNIINLRGNAYWSPARAHHDLDAFGEVRFEDAAPVIRPEPFEITDERVRVPMEIIGGEREGTLSVGLEIYGRDDVLPIRTETYQLSPATNERASLTLEASLDDIPGGTLAVYVREGERYLYYQSGRFPVRDPEVRTGFPEDDDVDADEDETADDVPDTAEREGELTEEEAAYARRWTAEELGETLLASSEWTGSDLGVSDEVPEPWEPMRVEGQAVEMWNRTYQYDDTLFPAQIETADETIFTGAPYFELEAGDQRYELRDAEVEIEQISDALVRVDAVAQAGPYRLHLSTDYEFDGMGKVTMRLEGDGSDQVEGLRLIFPLREQRSSLFHYTASFSGHPPGSDSGGVDDDGFTLDAFRELIWLGDRDRGFTWFAESMENWPIKDQQAIQWVTPVQDWQRRLGIKLADRAFSLDQPLELVFGIQATPTRPRDPNWRFLNDRNLAISWNWTWGDGQYYPFHDEPERGREHVERVREQGREVKPTSSLRFHGQYRFHQHPLGGETANPGLMHRELMLWEPLWRATRDRSSVELPRIPERHTAPGEWFGQRSQPRGLTTLCPGSPFQDYYLWKLHETIEGTGLGALYLDQPMSGCANPHHGCGYINHRGEWASSVPIFEMRRMMKRMHRLFHDAHGQTLIRWHSSNQIMVPAVTFADIFWDGENYGHGTLKVYEFFSDILSPERMQAQHTGRQFGFAADLLVNMRERANAPSPASMRDAMGWFMVHDSTVWVAIPHQSALLRYIQERRLAYPLDEMDALTYWQDDARIGVGPEPIKHLVHYKDDQALLALYNWSDRSTLAEVSLDLPGLIGAESEALRVYDVLSETELTDDPADLRVPVLPRDLRLLEIGPRD